MPHEGQIIGFRQVHGNLEVLVRTKTPFYSIVKDEILEAFQWDSEWRIATEGDKKWLSGS